MRRGGSVIVAGALVGSVAAVSLILTSTSDDNAARTAALVLLLSWSFVGTGLVARTRSHRRFGTLMCAVGLAVYLPRDGGQQAASVIQRAGEPVAALIHDASLALDPELVAAVAAAAGLALENERPAAPPRAPPA